MSGKSDYDDSTQPPSESQQVRHLLQYRLLDFISAGAMGKVFLAQDTRLDRLVALKTVAEGDRISEKVRDLAFREARVAARLSHQNICAVYAIEETTDTVFIAMEYVNGKTLRQMTRDGTIEPAQLVDIAVQCCKGLQAAHESGVVHRDVKSSNVMIDRNGVVKITDFGLARLSASLQTDPSGDIAGTYHYMSPEQITGKRLNEQTDIFSLGVVLYELSTGRLPFEGDSPAALTYSVVNEIPTDIRELRPELPEKWGSVVARAMSKDTAERYRAVDEILADLESPGQVHPARVSTTRGTTSVAVFPFRLIGHDEETGRLGDGLCEDLIAKLTKVRSLRVASRSAVFRFREESFDPLSVGSELNVDTVLEGSVDKHGDSVRVNLQLVRISDGSCIWSEVYDRELANVLEVRTDIAERVAVALGLKLSGEEVKAITRTVSAKPEAYDLYLRGKQHLKRRDRKSLEDAIELLTQAVDADPRFAEAHAQLATAFGLCLIYGFGAADKLARQAEELATRAVDLDPSSADAHMSLFFVRRREDIRKTIAELQVAIALNPSSFQAHHYLANAYVLYGHYQAAVYEERQAQELDPFQDISWAYLARIEFLRGDLIKAESVLHELLSRSHKTHLVEATRGWIKWSSREWGLAVPYFESALKEQPRDSFVPDYLADCYRREGRIESARKLLKSEFESKPDNFHMAARLGQLQLHDGAAAAAVDSFKKARSLLSESYPSWIRDNSAVYQYNLGWIYALSGDAQAALERIALSIKLGYGNYGDFRTRPDWELLSDTTKFTDLVASLKAVKSKEDIAAS